MSKEMSSCMENVQLAFENYLVNETKNYDPQGLKILAFSLTLAYHTF